MNVWRRALDFIFKISIRACPLIDFWMRIIGAVKVTVFSVFQQWVGEVEINALAVMYK